MSSDLITKLASLPVDTERVDLSTSQLTTLSELLLKFTRLRSLNLQKNKLTALPEWFSLLTSLEYLYVSQNQLTSLPSSISTLTALRELDLYGNQITSIPTWISTLTALQGLDLYNNQLMSVPTSISTLTALQRLYLYNNQLMSVPTSISTLKSLNYFNVTNNPLKCIPRCVVDTFGDRLKVDSTVPVVDTVDTAYRYISESDLNFESNRSAIGSGGFGYVVKASYFGEPVCVKYLKQDLMADDDMRQRFAQEIAVMAGLHHPRCLRLLGANMEGNPPYLVTDFMCGGSLFDLLHSKKTKLSGAHIRQLSLDILNGLNFLHSQRPPIIHRDLKSSNVLLADSSSMRAVVADFGLSRIVSGTSMTMTRRIGTPLWMAPEVMDGVTKTYDAKIDVWSFGMLLYEMVTNYMPFCYPGDDDVPYELLTHLKNGRRPILQDYMGTHVAVYRPIIEECWQWDPHRRPSISELLRRLP